MRLSSNSFYNQTVEDVFNTLNTGNEGLSQAQVSERQQKYGLNRIIAKVAVPAWIKFLLQFKDVMIILLIIASAISFIIGSYSDGAIMLIIVLINAVIGYLQEHKAERIMDSLRDLIQSPAKVFRDKAMAEVAQQDLVPGDIVQLEEGDKVPADIRLIESFNLKINEFSLTGESLPQEKNTNTLKGEVILADRENMAYLGTTVSTGSGKGVVTATGMNTEVGKIANLTQKEKTSKSPLQIEMQVIANAISIFATIIGLGLFGISIWKGFGFEFALIYALGVAVAVVPQALPMQITVALTNGVGRLAKRNAVVKKLSSVETLGSTNVLATDKTGTITKNEMTVKALWFDGKQYEVTGTGYEPKGTITFQGKPISQETIDKMEIMLDAGTMASNAEIAEPDDDHKFWYPVGDPTEAALITVSRKVGTRSPTEDEDNPELHEFSFDSFRKRMSSVRQFDERKVLCMKGSVGSVLSITKFMYENGKAVPFTESHKKTIEELNTDYSMQAMRVLAIAYRELDADLQDYVMEDIEKNVIFLGLMAMIDPPKEGVKEAIHNAHEAKIKTYIMTGDHAITAQAIGEEIQLDESMDQSDVISSTEFSEMDDTSLSETMREHDALIFSRVSPEEKLRIVRQLKKDSNIVAVTGDGVNDAPALKSAHIGIAMGSRGTDVAKEAAELIILDDSYSTIVHAIREGRTIYNNLKKTIIASLTSNIGELSIVLLGLLAVSLMDWSIPILAIQILAVDLLAEILPLTALTYDPAGKGIMKQPPRRIDEHMINRGSIGEILLFGFLMGGLAFVNYAWFLSRIGHVGPIKDAFPLLYQKATTISYVTIVACQFVNIMSRRYEKISIFNSNFFNNRQMLGALGLSVLFVGAAVYLPFINKFLKFRPLNGSDWLTVGAAMGVYLFAHELSKLVKRLKEVRE
jgi:Ca2+-transporting ATPase